MRADESISARSPRAPAKVRARNVGAGKVEARKIVGTKIHPPQIGPDQIPIGPQASDPHQIEEPQVLRIEDGEDPAQLLACKVHAGVRFI